MNIIFQIFLLATVVIELICCMFLSMNNLRVEHDWFLIIVDALFRCLCRNASLLNFLDSFELVLTAIILRRNKK